MAKKGQIKCILLQPENYDSAVRLMLEDFVRYENVCTAVGMPHYPNHGCEVEQYFYHLAEEKCSFVAVDQDSGDVVGAMFNAEVFKHKPETSEPLKDVSTLSTWDKVLAICRQNQSAIPNLFEHFSVEKYFYFGYLSVRRDYCSRGIGTSLSFKAQDFAKEHGHRLIVSDATCGETKHLFVDKMGFSVVGELKLRDCVWKGEKFLSSLDETMSLLFVAKTF